MTDTWQKGRKEHGNTTWITKGQRKTRDFLTIKIIFTYKLLKYDDFTFKSSSHTRTMKKTFYRNPRRERDSSNFKHASLCFLGDIKRIFLSRHDEKHGTICLDFLSQPFKRRNSTTSPSFYPFSLTCTTPYSRDHRVSRFKNPSIFRVAEHLRSTNNCRLTIAIN